MSPSPVLVLVLVPATVAPRPKASLALADNGNQLCHMKAGDSLTFNGEVPHGPEQLMKVPIHLLSIMNYGEEP